MMDPSLTLAIETDNQQIYSFYRGIKCQSVVISLNNSHAFL